jgi:outer membrane protein
MIVCLRAFCTVLAAAAMVLAFSATSRPEQAQAPGHGAFSDDGAQGRLTITLAEAILMALENNRSLAVQRLAPDIARSFEEEAQAAFDPVISAGASTQRSEGPSTASPTENLVREQHEGFIALDTYFPTGTWVALEAGAARSDAGLPVTEITSARIGIGITQSLLRGRGRDVNLATLRQAHIGTRISLYELQGFSENLVTRVEHAYWDYALSIRQVEIVEESLKLAEQQLFDTRDMISVGVLAEAELPAVQAEVALQRQGWIDVKSALAANRMRLLHLLNPPGPVFWERDVILAHPPAVPQVMLDDVESYVAAGLRQRPEINQAQLEIARGELEVVRTRNGLLPRLDLFIQIGKSGYADSFGGAVRDLDGDAYDTIAGITGEYPLFNRGGRARHERAVLGREQAQKALHNLNQLVELDIRTAYLEVNRTREQISAGGATRQWQEEKLRIETEKFRVGRSTNLLVAQAQRDLLVSRIDEVRTVVDYLKDLTDLYRLEGSLLERRGVRSKE